MKPIILDFATNRKGDDTVPYKYDQDRSMNVITVGNEKKVFIDTNPNDLSMLTKTKVEREKDDIENDILDIRTKTEVRRERDDNWNPLLEMTTKTFTRQERDDENFSNLQ